MQTHTIPSPAAPATSLRRTADSSTVPRPHRNRLHGLVRGRAADPAWVRPSLLGLLVATAVLLLWDLNASGYANSFYAAAAEAGAHSWKAFFFGSSDAGNSITVDKTPLALWPMDLSVRIFGLSSWSVLVPQALEGVAAVGLLYGAVRRTTGSPGAGLLAGATLALTPVAVLMFRFDNPDAMLVLLLVAAASATLRAVDAAAVSSRSAGRWLVLAGALVGLAFLAKMLQAFLVLPAFVLVYLLLARVPVVRRLGHLLAAFAAMLVAGGWWVLIVSLWPASDRPYIGGSQHNSVLELALGYNGFGRLTGNETGSVGGRAGAGGGGNWGATGITRLFDAEIGGQITWLIPAALILSVATLVLARRDRRVLAGVGLWLGWLLVTGLTFSFMAGIFHAYYTVALAPAVAALVGIGAHQLWARRAHPVAGPVLALALIVTTVWAAVLLGRSASFQPWLRPVVLVGGLGVAILLLALRFFGRRAAAGVAAAATVLALAGPAAYAVDTAATAHHGSIVDAGPTVAGARGFGGPGGFRGGAQGGAQGGFPGGAPGGTTGAAPGGTGGLPGGATGGFPGGAPGGSTGSTGGTTGGTTGGARMGGPGGGGLLDATTPSKAILAKLAQNSSAYTWAAATVGSNNAAGYQLTSGLSVMPIGGFNGSDPSPTLAQFKAWVAAGRIHWFIGSGNGSGGGMGPGGNTASAITQWVSAHYTATTVDGVTMYDLSGSAS